MATSPIFSKAGVSREGFQGVFQSDNGGFSYDPDRDVALPSSKDTRALMAELNSLMGTIDSATQELIQKGRSDQAQSLRILGDRLKRTANTRGISSEQIARQMSDVTNQLNAKQGLWESQLLNNKIASLSKAIGDKASVAQQAFNQDLSRANFREGVLKAMESSVAPSALGGGRQSGSGSRSARSVARSPIAVRRPTGIDPATLAAMEQRGRNFQDTMRLSKFMDERQANLARNNPGFRQTGSAFNTARAGQAVTQMNRGTMPGLFQSGARPGFTMTGFNPAPIGTQVPGILGKEAREFNKL